jgi:hypothetical protein
VLSIPDSLNQLARQFGRLLGAGAAGVAPLAALPGLGGTQRQGGSAVQRTVGQVAGGFLGGPLGLIAGALASLFSRERGPAELPLFERPEALALDFDVGRLDAMRSRDSVSAAAVERSSAGANSLENTGRPETSAPLVTIQVNAMDARSFAEHRDEIASAVREALSRNHGLRDEIWED